MARASSHVGIDKAWNRGACYLGDNRKYLRILLIGDYNLIDVDAYGVPYQQMKIIAQPAISGPGRRHLHSVRIRRPAVCDVEGTWDTPAAWFGGSPSSSSAMDG